MLKVLYGPEEALSQRMLKIARETAEREGERLLILVPEMATLRTEEELLSGLGLEGSFDLEVLSPSRLSERVFENEGQGEAAGRVRIDGQGKSMALAGVLHDEREHLVYYASSVHRQGFITECGALISNLKRARVTPRQLEEFAQGSTGVSADKLRDLARIYASYEERIAGRFVDGEDVTEAMLGRIREGAWLRGVRVAARGFDVITGVFARTLAALHAAGGDVTVLMRGEGKGGWFAPVTESVDRLGEMCVRERIPFDTKTLRALPGDLPGEIVHLRREFPRPRPQRYPGTAEAIRLFTGANPYFECRFAAREIRRLHDREGVPYGKMAVILCGGDRDAAVTESVLKAYDIPCYVPRALPAARHGAARFLISALKCALDGFRGEDLKALLGTGYAPVEEEKAWRLENFIETYNISGRQFLRPFERGKKAEAEAAALEEERSFLSGTLEKLRDGVRESASVRKALEAVYRFMEDTGVYGRLLREEKRLLEAGMETEAAQGRQMWKALLRLMDEMVELYGEEPVRERDLAGQLEAGLEACSLQSLPPQGDSVLCAECGGTAASHLEAVFITGLDDSSLSPAGEGLLTDEETRRMEKAGKVHLNLDADGREDLKRLDLYNALCASDRRVYLLEASAGQSGEARRPHLYWHRIRGMFPALEDSGSAVGREATDDGLGPLSARTAANELAVRFSAGVPLEGVWRDAWRCLCRETPALAEEVGAAFSKKETSRRLNREITSRLFLENVMSVSRLESFAACPYKHFVDYGLRPSRKEEWNGSPQETGSFYHAAIEGITRRLAALPGWPEVGEKEIDRLVEEESGAVFRDIFGKRAEENPKVAAAGKKYLRVLRKTAWMFTRGAQVSAFRTTGEEIRFGYEDENSLPAVQLDLEGGRRVLLRGRIDRVDRYRGDEGVYLRVVDYKSGSRELRPEQIFYGTQLQLMLYLNAALAYDREASPAGAYYMFFRDPLLKEVSPEDQAAVEKALAKQMHLSGISLRDVRVIELMDREKPPLTMDSLVLKSGALKEKKPLADLEEMRLLIDHARETARRLCVAMQGGHIRPEPLQAGKEDPCGQCDYKGICRQEESRARKRAAMTFPELFERLRQMRGEKE